MNGGGGYYEAEKVGAGELRQPGSPRRPQAFTRVLTPLQQQVNLIIRALLLVVVVFEILVIVKSLVGGHAVRRDGAHVAP